MDFSELVSFGAHPKIAGTLPASGGTSLYPPQEEAVKAGLFEPGTSLVVAAPTASGKTLIAEMAALDIFLKKGGKVIYLVPLRALAREKYEDFTRKYEHTGLRIAQSTGDFDRDEPWLAQAGLIITTNEKLDSLQRRRSRLLENLALVVADEVHLLGDAGRGPTLEVVLTRLRAVKRGLKVIALSATIPNATEIAHWLDARLVQSTWRPVPLKEGVFHNGAVIFNEGSVTWVEKKSGIDSVDLSVGTIGEGGQALVFVGTRKSSEALARKAGRYVAGFLSEADTDFLEKLSKDILASASEPTKLTKRLSESVKEGAAFHHAGIPYAQRKLVEDAFKSNRLKLLAATTTLAMGLNLPSRRVVIRDWWRYVPGAGISSIPAIEVKQMAGRAGRPGYDKFGEAVLVARSKRDEGQLFDKYIRGGPEEIESALASEAALRGHVLASIAGLFTRTRRDLMDFLGATFFAFQSGSNRLEGVAEDVLEFLHSEGLINFSGGAGYSATRLGHRISELYLDPLSGVIFRDALSVQKEKLPFALFHMLAMAPDMMTLSFGKKDFDELMEIFSAHAETLLVSKDGLAATDQMLSEIKTASVLMQWILETPEEKITDHFGIGPGDLRTIVELADWLLYAAQEVAKAIGMKDEARAISPLRVRVNYGVKEELLGLVSLKGVGRIRARSLYEAGVKDVRGVKDTSLDVLQKVPKIGHALALDLKKQTAEG